MREEAGTSRASMRWCLAAGCAMMVFGYCALPSTKGDGTGQVSAVSKTKDPTAPDGMVWIPGTEFTMGTDYSNSPSNTLSAQHPAVALAD